MRINEYNTLEEFTSQYIGIWAPSDGHWFGLDFFYKGQEYRMYTGRMYDEPKLLPDGRPVLYGLYKLIDKNTIPYEYVLLEFFATMDEMLKSTVINDEPFEKVIMADDTEILCYD